MRVYLVLWPRAPILSINFCFDRTYSLLMPIDISFRILGSIFIVASSQAQRMWLDHFKLKAIPRNTKNAARALQKAMNEASNAGIRSGMQNKKTLTTYPHLHTTPYNPPPHPPHLLRIRRQLLHLLKLAHGNLVPKMPLQQLVRHKPFGGIPLRINK